MRRSRNGFLARVGKIEKFFFVRQKELMYYWIVDQLTCGRATVEEWYATAESNGVVNKIKLIRTY